MASRLDPFGLIDIAARAARTGVKIASWSEHQAMALLRERLEAASAAPFALGPAPAAATGEALDDKLSHLLAAALEQGSSAGRQELFHKLLDQIVPDEARIIGALSDGSSSPLLNIYARTRAGLVGEVVLENASLVGKSANISLPNLTPMYVSHLLSLGLVETGPEDPAMKIDYEILGADPLVLKSIKKAGRGPIPARIDRLSLRLSGLGRELWDTAGAGRS